MNLIFELYPVSIVSMHQIYSIHTRDKEHKGPILKQHFCLILSNKQTFVTKVKKM